MQRLRQQPAARRWPPVGGPVRLPPPEQMRLRLRLRLIAEIWALYLPLLVRLRRRGINTVLAAARSTRGARIEVPEAERQQLAVRLGHIVGNVLDWVPFDNRCLIRSVVLVRVLARRSIDDATLVIGVRTDGGFAAHAWVEREGEALLPVGDHLPLTRL